MLANPFDDRPSQARSKVAATYGILITANIAAWSWAWFAFADRPALLGTAFLAYMFGLRHAFDADHIAAIDNVVRKLMQEGKRPYSVGLFFSLGHSTIVVLASIAIAVTAAAVQRRLVVLHEIGGVIGTAVSVSFLLVIGVLNLFVLKGVLATLARARRGEAFVEEDVDTLLAGRGLFARVFRPMFDLVSRSWLMYPIGLLFGLGFDTATEVGVLGISATQAAQGLSPWVILVFPALFTAGMSLMDATDSVLMTGAYGWAFVTPMRKLWYNLTITAASVAVAIFIGGIEALGLIGDRLGLKGGPWGAISDINGALAGLGYAVVCVFIIGWAASALVFRRRAGSAPRFRPGKPACSRLAEKGFAGLSRVDTKV